MSTQRPSATFLGIPPELRLHVYAYAVLLDVDFQERPSQYYTDDVSRAEPYCQDIQIPWLSLLRTCKLVAGEVKSFMSGLEYRTRDIYRTWEIDVSMIRRQQRKITRLRLPCNHRDVDAAIITIALPANRSAAEDHIGMNIINFAWQNIWEPLVISGPRMHLDQGLWPQPDIRKCTLNILDSGLAGADGKRPDMTMYRAAFNFWNKHGYLAEETILSVFEYHDGKQVVTGRIVLFGNALVDVSGFQLTPLKCHQASVDRWTAYKQQKSMK